MSQPLTFSRSAHPDIGESSMFGCSAFLSIPHPPKLPYPKPQRKPTRLPVVPSPPPTPSSSTPSSTKLKVVQLMVESIHVSSSKPSVNPISTLLYTLASMPENSLPLKSSPAPTLVSCSDIESTDYMDFPHVYRVCMECFYESSPLSSSVQSHLVQACRTSVVPHTVDGCLGQTFHKR